ncbi:MAG TPA: hypothetical protein VNJ50_12530 [Gelidibacter sp.]|uniref:hypothetical protein n=1 Tax=Gelidibacter sp. TaxID=2018083 RepID=UPI002C28465B|nr:hypothetical protein [Gelidibacter sp.]HXJ99669.1 hypothetical protein [Gelidibacter sp.]
MRKLWRSVKGTVKELIMTPIGIISIILSFLLLSGTPLIILGLALKNAWVYGIGSAIFIFYLAPNGVAIFGFIILAPLINKGLRLLFRYRKDMYNISKLSKYIKITTTNTNNK